MFNSRINIIFISETDPKKVKKASLDVALREDWEDIKVLIMTQLIQIKFQNNKLQKKLLNTGSQHIQEGNTWNDIFWGVDLKTQEGKNILGKIIMQVRKDLYDSHLLGKYLQQNKKIILFDGECNLCDRAVQILLKNDPKDTFRFTSLQSELGLKIQSEYGINPNDIRSVIVIDNYTNYKSKTAAIFSMTGSMGSIWPLFNIFWIVPKPLRNWVYSYIANNRYRWFGKRNTCMVMTDDIRHKFLD